MCEKCDADNCICMCTNVKLFVDLDYNVWGECQGCGHDIFAGYGS